MVFLEAMGEAPEDAPNGDAFILLGDFNTHVGSDSVTSRGVNLNLSGVFFLDLSASHSVSTTNTMVELTSVHQYKWFCWPLKEEVSGEKDVWVYLLRLCR